MKNKNLPRILYSRKILFIILGLLTGANGYAQAPSSLTYPTPSVFIANVNSVFLSPNVAGNVTSYAISPTTLPSGVVFDVNTGVISGFPTAAFPLTSYTLTATGPSGSTSTTLSLQITNNFFNNAYNAVNFSTSTPIRGDGTNVGDTVLYTGVSSLSGQSIDALVITKALTNVTSFAAYDQAAVSGGGYNSNSPAYFSPQVNFSAAGSVTFNFQFILGGSFNMTTRTAQSVTLQNVKTNTYDIDGNGNANSNQYAEFGGFDTSEVGSPTILATSFDLATNLTKFRSTISANSVPVIADSTRVRVTSNNISNFTIVLGAESNGAAYYVLDFSAGQAFATATKTPAPSHDLSTTLPGVNNVNGSCGGLLPFSGGSGQTNIKIVPATLNELSVTFDNSTANIRDGAGERIVINGGTPASSDTLLLNFAAGTSPLVTVGGVTYTVTRTVTGTTSILSFANNTGVTFTLAQGETLLDALQYGNTAANPTMGERNFTVNVRNASFKSPDAIFTPSVTCVSIAGNIYIDNNGLTDNTVNPNSTIGQLAANGAYAVLVNQANVVLAVQGVTAGGAYSFGKQSPGTYGIIVRNAAPAIGSTVTTASFPAGTTGTYRAVGENLGADAGNDFLVDGKLLVTVGSANITAANFGIELAPIATASSFTGLANPGGFNNYTIPNGGFNTTDEDGQVTSITITAYPAGANYLKIGTTYYTSTGSVCAPQVTCTTWPAGGVTVPFSNGNPTLPVSVDPSAVGTSTIVIAYTARDNAGVASNSSTVTLNFATTTPLTIAGNVWNDADGNGTLNGSEVLTNAALTGQTLYAYLVQTNTAKTYNGLPTIYASTVVNATTGYSFTDVAAGNDYEVHIVSAASAPAVGASTSSITPALGTNYLGVSTNKNGTITTGLTTIDPFIAFANLTVSQPNNNLGIERRPIGANYTASRQANPGISVQVSVPYAAFSATDDEDAAAGYTAGFSGRKVTLNPATNGTLYYNGVAVNTAITITGFNPALVTIAPAAAGATTPSFTFSVYDNAGVPSLANTVNMPLDAAVAISGLVWDDNNGNAIRESGTEPLTSAGAPLYAVLTDANGNVIESVLVSNTTYTYSFAKAAGSQAYKIVLATASPAIGTRLTAASLPANWVATGTNLSTVASTANTTGIISLTTPASGAVADQNFGIEQIATADAKTYSLSGNAGGPVTRVTTPSTAAGGGTYTFQIAMAGTAATGATPGTLSGTDLDGNNGGSLALGSLSGTGIKLSINPASYTALDKNGNAISNGIMLVYNGIQLQPGGCQGGNAGTVCTYYNSTTGAWEIPNYDASKLSILAKTGVKTQSFQYRWIDAAGKQGTTASYAIGSTIPLPVTLISFDAAAKGERVLLDWKVASEMRLSGYVIERSADAVSFGAIQQIVARNTGLQDHYEAVDAAPLAGISYYRLRMEEMDGTFSYSGIQKVVINGLGEGTINVYPNPVATTGDLRIQLSAVPVSGAVRIMDQAGRLVLEQALEHSLETKITLQGLPAGIYLVAIVADGQSKYTKLIVQ